MKKEDIKTSVEQSETGSLTLPILLNRETTDQK